MRSGGHSFLLVFLLFEARVLPAGHICQKSIPTPSSKTLLSSPLCGNFLGLLLFTLRKASFRGTTTLTPSPTLWRVLQTPRERRGQTRLRTQACARPRPRDRPRPLRESGG